MRKNLFVRSIAAVSGIVMLASLAACGDNTSSAGNNSGSTSTEKITGSFSGAGATSQQAAEEAWTAAYMAANSGANFTYNPTGSGAGVTTFLSGATAWAGSDKALSDDEVTQSSDKACANGTTAFAVPVYISPIAIIFNLKGVSDAGKHINLDADTAAKIFDGKIVKWNNFFFANQNKYLTPVKDILHKNFCCSIGKGIANKQHEYENQQQTLFISFIMPRHDLEFM